MRLRTVRLRNFRCYREETTVDLQTDDVTLLIGRNDVGKSSIMDALNIFLSEEPMDPSDASVGTKCSEVCITCEFDELPSQLVLDADHPTSLEEEYLVRGDERLVVEKTYDCSRKRPSASISLVAYHPTAEGVDDLLGLTQPQLKARAKQLGADLDRVNQTVNSDLRRAIREAVPDLQCREITVPLDKGDRKTAWQELKKHLPLYALFRSDRPSTDQDDEAQDPMKAAVDQAVQAQSEKLEEITRAVQRQVERVAENTVDKLREIDPSLAEGLRPEFQDPTWSRVFKIALKDDAGIAMNKRGSGVRRLILLSFFRAQAEAKVATDSDVGIIYAIEEPETSQHPHNQRILLRSLRELAASHDCQVIASTHNPNFARLVPTDCLRYVTCDTDGKRNVLEPSCDEHFARIASDLGVMADHSIKAFIYVEGPNDSNFLARLSRSLHESGVDVPDLASLVEEGCIVFILLGGKDCLARWVSRLRGLHLPEFYILDRDAGPDQTPGCQPRINEINSRPGCCAVTTAKREMENYLHPAAIAKAMPGINVEINDWCDVPCLVARAVHEASESTKAWEEVSCKKRRDKESKAKAWLNLKAAAAMTPDMLRERDPSGEVVGWLTQIGEMVDGKGR